jgi:spermidine synthase
LHTGILLKLIVFVTGAVLMAMEIVGSRILAPYFGSSIFVWGSLISTVLAALSVGYYWGGVLSERDPGLRQLAWLTLIPGVMILLLPTIYPVINEEIARVDFGIRWNPLLASLIYFMIPGIFIGTISPYAVRLDAKSLATVGNTAGVLYAISTCGSILGTLVTAFYLIPTFGVQRILHALGATLVLLSLFTLFLARGRRRVGLVFWMVFATLGTATLAHSRALLEKDSMYHRIRVIEEDGERLLYFDRTKQSSMDMGRPYDLKLPYTQHMTLAFSLAPDAKRALFMGLGGGSLPKKYAREFPLMEIDAVELDPEVVKIARDLFHVKETKNFRVHTMDGRMFLLKTPRVYQAIFLDAYYADAVPFHMTTVEFYRDVEKKLAPEGVLATNIIGAVSGPDSKMFRSMLKTLGLVFPVHYLFRVGGANGSPEILDNIIVLSVKSKKRIPVSDLKQRIEAAHRKRLVDLTADQALAGFWDRPLKDDDVSPLTDDYAPVDSLLHFKAY